MGERPFGLLQSPVCLLTILAILIRAVSPPLLNWGLGVLPTSIAGRPGGRPGGDPGEGRRQARQGGGRRQHPPQSMDMLFS